MRQAARATFTSYPHEEAFLHQEDRGIRGDVGECGGEEFVEKRIRPAETTRTTSYMSMRLSIGLYILDTYRACRRLILI